MDTTLFRELINFGALGIFAVLLIIFSRGLLLREQTRADAQTAEVIRLNTLIQEKTLPAIMSATQAIASSQDLLKSIQYRQDIEAEAKKVKTDVKQI